MHQVTILFDNGSFNRFSMEAIPQMGDEIAVVHGNGEEDVYRVNKV